MARARSKRADLAAWIGTKISATLIDFGQPLLALLPPDASLDMRKQIVGHIVLHWNAHVMATRWGQPEYLAQLRDTLAAATVRGELDPQALAAFETLSARHKLRRFVDDPRAIGLWEVRDIGPGQWNIRCDARLPEHLESPQRDSTPRP